MRGGVEITRLGVIGVCALLAACLVGCQPVRPQAGTTVDVRLDKPQDRATVQVAGDATVVEIVSASGIGGAEVRWPVKEPLAGLVLHLHLAGLEELRLEGGETVVTAGIASQSPYAQHAELQGAAGETTQLAAGEPYWPDVTLVAEVPAIPLRAGYFRVEVPAVHLAEANGRLRVSWIDFYRG